MSRDMSRDPSIRDLTAQQKAVLAVVVAALLVVGFVLREHAPGHLGDGFLVGAALALVGAAVAFGRVVLAPERASTFERAWTQRGDERDDAVLTRGLAVLGLCSLPLTGLAAVSVALGVAPAVAFALLMAALVGVLGVSFAVVERRS